MEYVGTRRADPDGEEPTRRSGQESPLSRPGVIRSDMAADLDPPPVPHLFGTYGPTNGPGRRAGATRQTRSARRRRAGRVEGELLDADSAGLVRLLACTVAWYVVPATIFVVWALTLSGAEPAGCVTDITGSGCETPRAHALGSFLAAGPRLTLALAGSVVVAVLLRRIGTTWRAGSLALAASVVGGGLSTVLISAVTGEPLG